MADTEDNQAQPSACPLMCCLVRNLRVLHKSGIYVYPIGHVMEKQNIAFDELISPYAIFVYKHLFRYSGINLFSEKFLEFIMFDRFSTSRRSF